MNSLTYDDDGLFMQNISIANDMNNKCMEIYHHPNQYTKKQIIDCIKHFAYSVFIVDLSMETIVQFRESMFFGIFGQNEFTNGIKNVLDSHDDNFEEAKPDVINLISGYLKAYIKFLETQKKEFAVEEFHKLIENITNIEYDSDSGASGATEIVE